MKKPTDTAMRMTRASRTFTRALDLMRPLHEDHKRIIVLMANGKYPERLVRAFRAECDVSVLDTHEAFYRAIEQQSVYAVIVEITSQCPDIMDSIRDRGFTKIALLSGVRSLACITDYDFWITEEDLELRPISSLTSELEAH